MHTSGQTSVQNNKGIRPENDKICCGKCAAEANSQHAHCGKTFIIRKGILEETSKKLGLGDNQWQLNSLTNHICKEFHRYFYDHQPEISSELEDLVSRSGADCLLLQSLNVLFNNLTHLLTNHFLVEENVLFPHITFLVTAKKSMSRIITSEIKSLDKYIRTMKKQHDEIESILHEISIVSGNYIARDNAIENFNLLYEKLRDMHNKMMQFIYMENNVLYPNSILLQKELTKMNLL